VEMLANLSDWKHTVINTNIEKEIIPSIIPTICPQFKNKRNETRHKILLTVEIKKTLTTCIFINA
jgi:hypothetical protein